MSEINRQNGPCTADTHFYVIKTKPVGRFCKFGLEGRFQMVATVEEASQFSSLSEAEAVVANSEHSNFLQVVPIVDGPCYLVKLKSNGALCHISTTHLRPVQVLEEASQFASLREAQDIVASLGLAASLEVCPVYNHLQEAS